MPVRWVITAAKGRRMPLDPLPVPDGNVWIDHIEGGTPIVEVALSHDSVPRNVPTTYQSHYASCRDAHEWRK